MQRTGSECQAVGQTTGSRVIQIDLRMGLQPMAEVVTYDRECVAHRNPDASGDHHINDGQHATPNSSGEHDLEGGRNSHHEAESGSEFYVAGAHGADYMEEEEDPAEYQTTEQGGQQAAPSEESALHHQSQNGKRVREPVGNAPFAHVKHCRGEREYNRQSSDCLNH